MGVCDIIPGVSGGTIAFITGIYFDLIENLNQFDKNFFKKLFKLRFREAFAPLSFSFLLFLGLGIATAIVSTSHFVHYLLENYSLYTWSLFFGLILASFFELMKEVELKQNKNLFFLVVGIFLGYLIVGLVPIKTPDNFVFIFFSGAVAISAMILPGISGSFLLLILGKYKFIITAIKNPFVIEHILVLLSFGLGCTLGLLSFVKLLKLLIDKYEKRMFCILSGFILGAQRKIWPWKRTLETQIIKGKSYILSQENILPSFTEETVICLGIMLFSFLGILLLLGQRRRKADAI